MDSSSQISIKEEISCDCDESNHINIREEFVFVNDFVKEESSIEELQYDKIELKQKSLNDYESNISDIKLKIENT